MSTILHVQDHSLAMDDSELVIQASNSAEAFAELYRRHVAGVYRYHLVHTGSIRDAEDLTSQTFMAALEGLRSYRSEGSFAAWLMGIAARKKALFFRGHRWDSLPLDAVLDVPAPGLSTDQAVFQHLQFEKVHRALRHISPDRAEVITLSFFGGLTASEIGRVLGKNDAAVKMLLSRGLRDLRERTSLALEVKK